MANDRFLGLLGIASGARKLTYGLQHSVEAAADRSARLIIVADDMSEKSAKEAAFAAKKHGIDCINVSYTTEQLGHAVGHKAGVLAVCDGGFADRLSALYNN